MATIESTNNDGDAANSQINTNGTVTIIIVVVSVFVFLSCVGCVLVIMLNKSNNCVNGKFANLSQKLPNTTNNGMNKNNVASTTQGQTPESPNVMTAMNIGENENIKQNESKSKNDTTKNNNGEQESSHESLYESRQSMYDNDATDGTGIVYSNEINITSNSNIAMHPNEDELELELEQMYDNHNKNDTRGETEMKLEMISISTVDNINDNNKHLKNNMVNDINAMTNIDANLGEIEGLEANTDNAINELKVNNWKEWNKQEVIEWIEMILKENNFENDEIKAFINETFVKLRITGKILLKLKTNDAFWKQFQTNIEPVSFGIWIALSSEILNLKEGKK